MGKKIFILIICLLPLFVDAQVTVNAQLPPAGLVQKDQLWNLILVNNNPEVLEVTIKISLKNALTGQSVLSGISGNLALGTGVKMTTVKDIQPILYNYDMSGYSDEFLPLGNYIVCYQISGEKGTEPLSEDCLSINIDPLSPPLLNTPADKAEIETPYPLFTWLPPTPLNMFNNLNYEILVTEIIPGQSASEAIQNNIPFYTKKNIKLLSENYPSSFSALDTGKLYAWQVLAYNEQNIAVKTEIWTFSLKENPVKTIIKYAPFIKLGKVGGAIAVVHQGRLKMEIDNKSTDKSGRFIVRNISSKKEESSIIFEIQMDIITGQNFLEYDMNKKAKLNKDNIYEVEYINSNHESMYMKFKPIYY